MLKSSFQVTNVQQFKTYVQRVLQFPVMQPWSHQWLAGRV